MQIRPAERDDFAPQRHGRHPAVDNEGTKNPDPYRKSQRIFLEITNMRAKTGLKRTGYKQTVAVWFLNC
jgi:hypothetical protein